MMTTFQATDLNNSAQKVFKTAATERMVIINHARYPELVFELTARPRGKRENLHEFMPKHREDNDE